MKLLFITQKIDERDDDLAFVTQWVDEFIVNGFEVEVICLGRGSFDDRFPVYSLGKESGSGKLTQSLRFLKLVFTLKYERVFVHMNPEYFTLAGWYWYVRRIPMFLWYTHYTTHIHLKLAGFYCQKMFAATKQSLPQYEGNSKKVVTGHGVDTRYWHHENECASEKSLLMVHRLSRSKRVELGIKALLYLPTEYTLTIYGRPVDPEYYAELQALVREHNLSERINFKGSLPMPELRAVYPQYRIMVNMASETIDKTMLEAMCNGVFPVTTSGNTEAIGLPTRIEADTPEAIAKFILSGSVQRFSQSNLLEIVDKGHSLQGLVKKMSEYIKV